MCVVSVLILLVGIYTKEGTAVTKAPLRETLAAGLIKVSGWDLVSPLVDPFTGSGTIPIEATTLALGLAPGRNRKFSFLNWPAFNMDLWKNVQKQQLRFSSLPVLPLDPLWPRKETINSHCSEQHVSPDILTSSKCWFKILLVMVSITFFRQKRLS
eukprot:TRINITY_DN1250_c0_g2_i30.p1 TRINITY_DN1250_c0_g2~~TRINITY_DN1250_c0_g2_i30.p1  ORF type:complete len:156 (+),score=23.66 TRINITY_DN1250_c0_g2_i30:26-493(+)